MVSDILAEFRPQSVTYKTLHVILYGLSKFAQNFTAELLKLLSTYTIHFVVIPL